MCHDYKTITTTLLWCSPVAEQIPSQRTDTANLSVPSLDPLANYHDSTSTNWFVIKSFSGWWFQPLRKISQWEGVSHILWNIKECSNPNQFLWFSVQVFLTSSRPKIPNMSRAWCCKLSWRLVDPHFTGKAIPQFGGIQDDDQTFFVGFYKLISFRFDTFTLWLFNIAMGNDP